MANSSGRFCGPRGLSLPLQYVRLGVGLSLRAQCRSAHIGLWMTAFFVALMLWVMSEVDRLASLRSPSPQGRPARILLVDATENPAGQSRIEGIRPFNLIHGPPCNVGIPICSMVLIPCTWGVGVWGGWRLLPVV